MLLGRLSRNVLSCTFVLCAATDQPTKKRSQALPDTGIVMHSMTYAMTSYQTQRAKVTGNEVFDCRIVA